MSVLAADCSGAMGVADARVCDRHSWECCASAEESPEDGSLEG
jgi:hypothetical protein